MLFALALVFPLILMLRSGDFRILAQCSVAHGDLILSALGFPRVKWQTNMVALQRRRSWYYSSIKVLLRDPILPLNFSSSLTFDVAVLCSRTVVRRLYEVRVAKALVAMLFEKRVETCLYKGKD